MRFKIIVGITALALSLVSAIASADQWGCEVLLCLSNPDRPTAVAECKPPIHRLWEHLRRGHSFPSCDEARGEKGGSFARMGFSYYDHCPDGTRALAKGEQAAKAGAARTIATRVFYSVAGRIYSGIGEGDGYAHTDRGGSLPPKVCVGSKLGVTWVSTDARSSHAVTLYDKLVTLAPHASPRIIDVYINDAFYQRVRW